MGQFLIVEGRDPVQVAESFRRATRLFSLITGLQPCATLERDGLAVAKFAKLNAATPGIHSSPRWGSWMCSAGTWFYKRLSGPEAQRRFCVDLEKANGRLESLLDDADGSFALVVGDAGGTGFRIVTDRLGSLHVYEARIGDTALVSTSSLVLAALIHPKWDLVSCHEFLSTGTVFEQRTLFHSIEKIRPASIARFSDGKSRSASIYWDLAAHMYDRASNDGGVPALAEALQESIATIIRSYPNAVFDLTGGFDSRALVGAALKSGAPFSSVVNGGKSDADVTIADQIASKFQLKHRHQRPQLDDLQCWWKRVETALFLCDGEYNALEYAGTYQYHAQLSREFQVSVNGSGGEICKGYWWELLYPRITRRHGFDSRRVAALRFAFDTSAAALSADQSLDLVEHFRSVIERANKGYEDLPNTAKLDNIYLTLRMHRWQGRIASATTRIWNCSSPFMLRRPMEIAIATAPRYRVRNRMTRRLIEHLGKELASIPVPDGGPALPLRPTTAHLFLPLAHHMLRKLRSRMPPPISQRTGAPPVNVIKRLWATPQLNELLKVRDMVSAGLYSPGSLEQLLQQSRGPEFAHPAQFGRIVSLELLARTVYKHRI